MRKGIEIAEIVALKTGHPCCRFGGKVIDKLIAYLLVSSAVADVEERVTGDTRLFE